MIINRKNIQSVVFLYIGIFAISIFYRFYNLDKRGYFPRSDAPAYAGIIKTYRASLDYIINGVVLKRAIGSMNDYLYENGGQFGSIAKDGLIPIGLIGSIIFGNKINTMLYISAFFGVLTVMLIFYMLSKNLNLFLSFIIALMFAVSPYHIGFSREGLTVTLASFFLLAGIYLYIRSLQCSSFGYLYFCGIALGFGFLCHYNIVPFIFVLFVSEVWHFLVKRSNFKRIPVLFFSTLLPLLLADIFTRIMKFYGVMQHIKMIEKFQPFFNTLRIQLMEVQSGGSDINQGFFYYFKNLFYHEGIIVCILFIAAILIILRRGVKFDSGIGYFLVSMFILPFFYFLKLQHNIADRAILSFIPLGYFIIGYGFKNLNKNKILVVLAIITAVSINSVRSLDYFNYRSNFEQPVNYMRQNKGAKLVTVASTWSLARLYVGRKNVAECSEPPFVEKFTPLGKVSYQVNPVSIDKLESLYRDEGYNYLLLNIPLSISNELTEAAMKIKPEYSSDTMVCNDRGYGYDYALLRDKKAKYVFHFNVYDLGKVLNAMQGKN